MAVAGLIIGMAPIHRYGVNCGSPFTGLDTSAAEQADLTNAMEGQPVGLSQVQDSCEAAVSDRGPFAWALVVPGGLMFAAAISATGVVRLKHDDDDNTTMEETA